MVHCDDLRSWSASQSGTEASLGGFNDPTVPCRYHKMNPIYIVGYSDTDMRLSWRMRILGRIRTQTCCSAKNSHSLGTISPRRKFGFGTELRVRCDIPVGISPPDDSGADVAVETPSEDSVLPESDDSKTLDIINFRSWF